LRRSETLGALRTLYRPPLACQVAHTPAAAEARAWWRPPGQHGSHGGPWRPPGARKARLGPVEATRAARQARRAPRAMEATSAARRAPRAVEATRAARRAPRARWRPPVPDRRAMSTPALNGVACPQNARESSATASSKAAAAAMPSVDRGSATWACAREKARRGARSAALFSWPTSPFCPDGLGDHPDPGSGPALPFHGWP
jgi:hypothetical protein